jgi:hypothetical protein
MLAEPGNRNKIWAKYWQWNEFCVHYILYCFSQYFNLVINWVIRDISEIMEEFSAPITRDKINTSVLLWRQQVYICICWHEIITVTVSTSAVAKNYIFWELKENSIEVVSWVHPHSSIVVITYSTNSYYQDVSIPIGFSLFFQQFILQSCLNGIDFLLWINNKL